MTRIHIKLLQDVGLRRVEKLLEVFAQQLKVRFVKIVLLFVLYLPEVLNTELVHLLPGHTVD